MGEAAVGQANYFCAAPESLRQAFESCVVGKLGLLHDYAEHLACELINEVLVAGQEPCAD